MKKNSIKAHLKNYSIYQKRWTTINHAFAAAQSVAQKYDPEVVDRALGLLGQDPEGELSCVYCDRQAQTWDHVTSTVSKGRFSGVGHQVGNLVPCCKACNSAKGSKNWELYLYSLGRDEAQTDRRKVMLSAYMEQHVVNIREQLELDCHAELEEMETIKQQIYQLMKKADVVAASLRQKIQDKFAQSITEPVS